jgi:hypothetical protein
MRLALACLLVACACKQDDRSASTPPPAAPETPAHTALPAADAGVPLGPPRPCPTGPALKDAIAAALHAKADEITDASCNEVTAPRKLWVIDAIRDANQFESTLALLDARDGGLVYKENTGQSDRGLAKATITVVDLDGDGVDEVLRSATVGANGFAQETLHVLAVRGDKLVEIWKLAVRSENTGAVTIGMAKPKDHYECQSTTKVIAGPPPKKRIEIVGDKRKGKPPAVECPAVGRHVYAFDGKAVTEVRDVK